MCVSNECHTNNLLKKENRPNTLSHPCNVTCSFIKPLVELATEEFHLNSS